MLESLVLYEFIIADIPGLIAGAASGKGLGHKFLRHIKRTEILFHCVSLENEDVVGVYQTIRAELEAFDPEVAKKAEYVIFTKSDALAEEEVEAKIKLLAPLINKKYFIISVFDDVSIKKLSDDILKLLRK